MCRPARGMWNALAAWLALASLGSSIRANQAEPIRLEHWLGPAQFVLNTGPGTETFRLAVRARWDRATPRERGRYAMRVTLPGRQVVTTPLTPREATGDSRLDVLVPAAGVRNLRPEQVRLQAAVVDVSSGALVSNVLEATITDFPTPDPGRPRTDPGPFGWGKPLPTDRSAALPRPSPDGLSFIRLPVGPGQPAVYLSATEASNRQVALRLEEYEPPRERSDEFPLEDPEQPAFGLTPARAEAYCEALGMADSTGIDFRLPRRMEWLSAARAGASTPFWWGDAPTHPDGANFLGPEPALDIDATAPTRPGRTMPAYTANPWGLYHTFGNIAEWVAANPDAGGYQRMGGHFRTESAVPLPEPSVADPEEMGGDAFVGVRPAFELSADAGAEQIGQALRGDEALAEAGIQVAYDPGRATATLTGTVAEPALRRRADQRTQAIWWLAAVENRIATPGVGPGHLAEIGGVQGPARRTRVIDVILDTLPLEVLWADALPVRGSEWWVNLYTPDGGHHAYKLDQDEVGGDRSLPVHLDRRALERAGIRPGSPVSVALSLGAPAPAPGDPNLVSNVATFPMPLEP